MQLTLNRLHGTLTSLTLKLPLPRQKRNLYLPQAHVCISSTTRIGAELGYDISILRDGIGDRDIPGAKANELVDVSISFNLYFHLGVGLKNVGKGKWEDG